MRFEFSRLRDALRETGMSEQKIERAAPDIFIVNARYLGLLRTLSERWNAS